MARLPRFQGRHVLLRDHPAAPDVVDLHHAGRGDARMQEHRVVRAFAAREGEVDADTLGFEGHETIDDLRFAKHRVFGRRREALVLRRPRASRERALTDAVLVDLAVSEVSQKLEGAWVLRIRAPWTERGADLAR